MLRWRLRWRYDFRTAEVIGPWLFLLNEDEVAKPRISFHERKKKKREKERYDPNPQRFETRT